MNRKKRDGSALVVVLLFSLLFVVFSGVSVLAVVNTLRANEGEKYSQTLYYEAEGGIAEAKARANKGHYDTLTEISPAVQFNYSESSTNDHVFVSVKYTGDKDDSGNYINSIRYLQIESIAVKNGIPSDNPYTTTKQKRMAKAKLRPNMSNSDYFKYSICGESIEIKTPGTIKGNTSAINSSHDAADIGSVGASESAKEDNDLFALPEFDENKIPKAGGTLVINDLNSISSSLYPSSIKSMSITSAAASTYKVYMINADRVEINCGGNIVNVMIITNGDITIKTGGSDLKMTACSIVGKSVNIEEGNIDISFTSSPHISPYEGHSPLSDENVKTIFNSVTSGNEGITYYAPNLKYNDSSTPPPGTSTNGKYSGYDYN
ncbi:hypothetical protein [Clostridium paraputrificum]|uniref:Uncharacterized protein n=1 Tax=Clostridium paraputrificum TaxID=29363 RepID=A0A6N3D6N4_9CLOT